MPTGWKTIWPGSIGPTASRPCSATGSAAAPGPRSIFSSAGTSGPAASRIHRSSKPGATTARPRGFPPVPGDDVLRIFTTRPDTLYGATYMVVAPEHPLVERLTHARPGRGGASLLRAGGAQERSGPDRPGQGKDRRLHRLVGRQPGQQPARCRSGWPTMCWPATAPARSWPCRPTTRAISSSPSSSALGIVPVVDPGRAVDREPSARRSWPATAVFTGAGTAINSGPYDGQPTAEMQKNIVADLAGRGQGREAVNYKLRDWLFSRQHFWGEPFPILHELDAAGQPTGLVRTVPPEQLPVDLPELTNFKSHGSPDPPLEQAPPDWLYPTIDGRRYKRETNTMPQWAGSCWYYLRFLDPEERSGVRRSARSNGPGCRSICISAEPSMRCCTCSTPASGTRCCSIAATSARPSRSRSWSTRE